MSTNALSSGSASGTVSPKSDASGYLLLTIQHAVVDQIYDEQQMTLARGEMRLECVSLPIPPEIGKQTANPFAPSPSDPFVPTHDFWLVFRVSTFEFPLLPTEPVTVRQNSTPNSRSAGITYEFQRSNLPGASILLTLPIPTSAAVMEDVDSFEVLLRQYGCLGSDQSGISNLSVHPLDFGPGASTNVRASDGSDLRGRLLLVDEENGEVVGELEQTFDLEEDRRVADQARDRPVVVDFGNLVEGYAGRTVKVQTVPEDELNDWMLLGAHTISKHILNFRSWSTKTIAEETSKFVMNSKPYTKPVEFSSTAKAGIRGVHNATVKTVSVTKKTIGMINGAIASAVESGYRRGVEPAVEAFKESNPPSRRGSLAPSEPNTLPPQTSTSIEPSVEGLRVEIPTKQESMLIKEMRTSPPPYTAPSSSTATHSPDNNFGTPSRRTSESIKKRPFFRRALLAAEVVLTSLEATATDLINAGTAAASTAAGHKYGPDAGHATALLGGSVRNVTLVYIDIQGVGRRGLLMSQAKGFVKTRLKSGEEVKLQAEDLSTLNDPEQSNVEKDSDGSLVVGVAKVDQSK